jgi:hypothetical protein
MYPALRRSASRGVLTRKRNQNRRSGRAFGIVLARDFRVDAVTTPSALDWRRHPPRQDPKPTNTTFGANYAGGHLSLDALSEGGSSHILHKTFPDSYLLPQRVTFKFVTKGNKMPPKRNSSAESGWMAQCRASQPGNASSRSGADSGTCLELSPRGDCLVYGEPSRGHLTAGRA